MSFKKFYLKTLSAVFIFFIAGFMELLFIVDMQRV